ncbi:hypothetical protein [Desulfovibrio falkowii]|uniref:hypothetical protein n=1 Tax=Desulfovibrio sp. WGS1351 TaxID=3366814 RepID=UPI00372CFB45
MQKILSILTQGLAVCSQKHTAATLGDRSRYVGMSDIGKAADCLRAAVASKVYPSEAPTADNQAGHGALLRNLRMQRGHWFEKGVAEAFRLTGMPVLHQMSIHTRHNYIPVIAHLDFVFISNDKMPHVHVVEMKSCEKIPDTAYAAHEVQLSGQIGMLKALWNRPGFMVQPGPLRTFPELVRHVSNIALPEQSEKVIIGGAILMLSVNDVRVFGPYTPNKIMLDVCLGLAENIWNNAEQVRSGKLDLNRIPTAKGWHPLCDYCEWNADCPRFDGLTAADLEQELLALQSLKDKKDVAAAHVQKAEKKMKRLFQGISPGQDWINTVTQRFRVGTCDGRRTLDKDLLLAALETRLPIDDAEAVIQKGYKTGEPFERLYVSPINQR